MIEAQAETLLNYVGGQWVRSQSGSQSEVRNPATAKPIAFVPLSAKDEVDAAVQAAVKAFPDWRNTPVTDRIKPLFKLKGLLEAHLDELGLTITNEAGKTYAESVAEMARGIENVEVACGAPILMQGQNNEDIARGIDEHMIRQPLGVVAAITPFNFPGMIPLWFLPYAVATGNCFLLKPSERVPMTTQLLFRLLEQAGFPPGVVGLVNGGKETVDAILDHPDVKAISFVGSTPVARYIYARAAANGKRAQCQGGAKNPAVVLPDADMDMTSRILTDSAFGCAGQRCLANSNLVVVGEGLSEQELDERYQAIAEAFVAGIRMVYDQLIATLTKAGLAVIDAQGAPFNPDEHEAIAYQPADGVAEGHVMLQTRGGYRLGDRVIRPATVIVSSGAPPPPEASDAQPGEGDEAADDPVPVS